MRSFYMLLTERLKCPHCKKPRDGSDEHEEDEDSGDDTEKRPDRQQYLWHAWSPAILMALAPAVQNTFPAILCGRCTVDKNVVTQLGDRINSISMNKVHRMVQHGHDEWYAERRDLYQMLLYEAHSAASSSSQQGILTFLKPPGSYTPPPKPMPIPCARVFRRAHMLMEMEKMSMYRESILSTTGEILCMDGTKQILKKIYGDGQGTMQYVTSILNEWGQFLTTVVVAAESEECYRRLARGLIARFHRASAAAPLVLYVDTNCCRDGGTSWLEGLFQEWVDQGMVIRLDIRHWLHRWDAVVIKQSHAKYGLFMSALSGAVLAYNLQDLTALIQAVRQSNEALYGDLSDDRMIPLLKAHQMKQYVRRVTRGVEVRKCHLTHDIFLADLCMFMMIWFFSCDILFSFKYFFKYFCFQETAEAVEHIIAEFKGPAGLDSDGIALFKSPEAVDAHWAGASKHLSCMQDPPGVPLYITTKVMKLGGMELNTYKCRRGSNALEGLHSHLLHAVPSNRCGIMQFQVITYSDE